MFFLFTNLSEPQTRDKDIFVENLILEMAKGSTSALEEFYKETDSAIYGFALSILKVSHEAEDVMQEAYIKIFESASSYNPMGKPMAWVFTIVRNLALSRYRSKDYGSAEFAE